ncbi:MAG: hypothetical protein Kow00121_31120 [Elainellaceae cyanobacterium]
MKFTNLAKVASAGILSLGLVVAPLSISASATEGTTVPDAGIGTTDIEVEEEDDGFDWGWLGLLGLIGLAGLAGKKRDDDRDRYREPSTTTYAGTTATRDPNSPSYRDPNLH